MKKAIKTVCVAGGALFGLLTVNLIFMQTNISSFWAIMFESYICGMHSLA